MEQNDPTPATSNEAHDNDKQACLARAKHLLAVPTPVGVRYAALELRIVMELLTYERLRASADLIPPEVLATWQPPQAVRALLEFQPMADQTFTIDVGKHPPDSDIPQEWLRLGEHTALSAKWLGKHYHKVGGLLHAPTSPESGSLQPAKQAAYLAEVGAELERAMSGGITGFTERGGYAFNCGSCGKLVIRNNEAMDSGKTARCSTRGCDAEYKLVRLDDGKLVFEPLAVNFVCQGCGAPMAIASRKVALGVTFSCRACNQRFAVMTQQWGINKIE